MIGSSADLCCVDVFKFDPDYAKNEEIYQEMKVEILGEDSEEESGAEGDGSDEDDEDSDEEPDDGISSSSLLFFTLCGFWTHFVALLKQRRTEQLTFTITLELMSSIFVELSTSLSCQLSTLRKPFTSFSKSTLVKAKRYLSISSFPLQSLPLC